MTIQCGGGVYSDLTGKVALVGGSTDGIGKAVALKLAECGADICVNGRSPAKGAKVVEAIENLGRRAFFASASIREYEQCEAMVAETIAKLGRLDIAVANGGAQPFDAPRTLPNYFRNTEIADFAELAHSRWLSRAYLMRAALEPMIEQHYGKIVVITTDAGRWPTPGEAVNGGAAAGLIMMNRVVAKEITRWGVRLNTVAISLTGDSMDEFGTFLDSPVGATFRKIADKMPFGLTPRAEVADAVLYFASPDSDHCTGAVLSINGGLSFP
jgi:2-hydroxycyclohexanecarboxyl-CoA dehydrogenase